MPATASFRSGTVKPWALKHFPNAWRITQAAKGSPVRTIRDYFERIETSMAAGEAILARRDPSQASTVKAKCTEAALLIASYQMHVHRAVFEPLMTSADDTVRRQVCLLKAEGIGLTEDLRVGVKALAVQDAPIDFAAITSRVTQFNTRVRAHIAAVTALLDAPGGALREAA